jgi:Tfp pilus assembly protein PilF
MYCTNIATSFESFLTGSSWNKTDEIEQADSRQDETLAIALYLLESGRLRQADELLTAATLEDPTNPEIWLAAGICRMRQGAIRSAEAAFEMSAWLDDNIEARNLYGLCSNLPF